ncbi:multicopper oxidase domain-containing protein [Aequorivita antarctica]|uniref:Copper oxidase n=1 Tax=Aequorivita antarctica TaxID=153266 RepID=A0A5C6Z292_9FLAO|nr:multicopper oxidase domain-containing protein [Aequorivita antarctica]TXD73501.1 copper oxidase [Aequorivita antarctica]SRX75707.1 Copper resistance protein A [Aequorivita antarctica]
MKNIQLIIILIVTSSQTLFAQSVEGNVDNLPVKEYTITLREEMVNKAGKEVKGMTVNGTIPGPILEFTEGEYAVIYVKNEMSVETSVHWHGILLPNFNDGVPYLTTPPIKAGTTFKYEFAINQNGTYWYHSHTMLQEQSGVFGSIVIHPKEENLDYDKELVLMLSDWTNEKPMNVLRNLKRGNEWYQMKKGTSTPLNQVIARGAFGAQLDFWRQRMEGADIADIYYPAFLVNGKEVAEYPEFQPGEKIRLRIINGAASSQFWMTFGGQSPTMVSADGKDIVPVKRSKTFIAIAETYDFIITVPENGKIEFRSMAQDGSGTALAYIGNGKILPAEIVPKPDKIQMMQKMAKMKMKMGAHALKFQPGKDERFEMKEEYGMQMDDMKRMEMDGTMKMDHSNMKKDKMSDGMKMDSTMTHMDHNKMENSDMKMEEPAKSKTMDMNGKDSNTMQGMDMFSEYNYDYLKSPEKTTYAPDIPVNEILLNLTGNMSRYIWSMNGVPLAETDKIKIKGNQVTRIKLNNLTMMHHPMHLHGHFFRVINKNGEYSPLKHTVNVPPMQEVTIEFYGDEYGDWFFHCHILYHLVGGMARVMSYDTPRDTRMEAYPVSKLIHETNQWYSWGMVDAASHMTGATLMTSNIRNQFTLSAEYGWNENIEAEFTYERYLHDYFRVFGGVNVENEGENSLDEISTTAIAGIRYLTPYLFNLDVRMDSKLRPQISLSRAITIFPRTVVFGVYEYQADFGWVDDLPQDINFKKEVVWSAGIEYFLSINLSIMGSYDNRFGAGGGLSARF